MYGHGVGGGRVSAILVVLRSSLSGGVSHSLHSGDATGFHTFATWRGTQFYSLLNHKEEESVCVWVGDRWKAVLSPTKPPPPKEAHLYIQLSDLLVRPSDIAVVNLPTF